MFGRHSAACPRTPKQVCQHASADNRPRPTPHPDEPPHEPRDTHFREASRESPATPPQSIDRRPLGQKPAAPTPAGGHPHDQTRPMPTEGRPLGAARPCAADATRVATLGRTTTGAPQAAGGRCGARPPASGLRPPGSNQGSAEFHGFAIVLSDLAFAGHAPMLPSPTPAFPTRRLGVAPERKSIVRIAHGSPTGIWNIVRFGRQSAWEQDQRTVVQIQAQTEKRTIASSITDPKMYQPRFRAKKGAEGSDLNDCPLFWPQLFSPKRTHDTAPPPACAPRTHASAQARRAARGRAEVPCSSSHVTNAQHTRECGLLPHALQLHRHQLSSPSTMTEGATDPVRQCVAHNASELPGAPANAAFLAPTLATERRCDR